MRLKEKVVLITGIALGQGKAASLLFAKEGAKIVGCDILAKEGQEVARKVKENGGKMVFMEADVSREDQVKALIEFAVKTFGRIDVFYNNAGLCRFGPITEFSEEDFRFTLTNEICTIWYPCKYGLHQMLKQGGGNIINIASATGLVGIPTHAAHAATKAGVIGLTRQIAVDYAKYNIRANCICPGFIKTEGQTKEMSENPEFIAFVKQMQLIDRMGTPEDIAYCALYLASDESSFVTGAVFTVDGGWSAH